MPKPSASTRLIAILLVAEAIALGFLVWDGWRGGAGRGGSDVQHSVALFSAVCAFVLSMVILFFVVRPLGRRLGELERFTKRIAAGEYAIELPEHDHDEIGQLARSFGAMAEHVRKREEDLRVALVRLQEADFVKGAIAKGLDAERSRLLSLLAAMRFGVAFVDPGLRIMFANPSFASIWLLPGKEDPAGQDLFAALAKSGDPVAQLRRFQERFAAMVKEREGTSSEEVHLHSGRVLKVQTCPVMDSEDRFQGTVVVAEDVSQARQAQSQLAFLAERDPLTGLHNRRSFERQLATCLEGARREDDRVALFFFDLDEFKSVNDMFGHRMGDATLQQVASAVSGHLRSNEFFARIGGDEFALITTRTGREQAAHIAERLVSAIGAMSVELDGTRLSLTASLGLALAPDHAVVPGDLIAHADAAMYQAKDAGKNAWRIYHADHSSTLRQRSLVTWNERIREALRRNALLVELQGVFDSNTGKRSHSEALLRMKDEKTGEMLPTAEIIAAAEKSNLIVEIDRWMIGAVVAHLAAHPDCEPIAVNISGRSFDAPDMAGLIANRLRASGVEAGRLYIEITETSAIRDIREAQRFIEAMHATGCHVCLDDFGAGFATFAYIKQLPVDVLKIDGLFIRGLPGSRDNQVFVKGMAEIAKGLGKITVAEAVEDHESLAMLRSYGVDFVQGYALERPQPLASARACAPPAAERVHEVDGV